MLTGVTFQERPLPTTTIPRPDIMVVVGVEVVVMMMTKTRLTPTMTEGTDDTMQVAMAGIGQETGKEIMTSAWPVTTLPHLGLFMV